MATANTVLEHVSAALIEKIVRTTLGTNVVAGVHTVTPPSMIGIYNGALLVCGTGTTQEVITVTGVTPTQFTATFANAHASNDTLEGATFPSGQTTNPIWRQDEMLGYLADSQNAFLLHVRSYFQSNVPVDIALNERYYSQPDVTVRLERISVDQKGLYNESQTDLDRGDTRWMSQTGYPPRRWFQDKINIARYGFDKLPSRAGTANLWYSARGAQTLALTDQLLVSFPFTHILKYGVLARAWSKDGIQRDPVRADYCEKRFRFGINLSLRFMGEVEAAAVPNLGAGMRVSPMQVPQEVGQ